MRRASLAGVTVWLENAHLLDSELQLFAGELRCRGVRAVRAEQRAGMSAGCGRQGPALRTGMAPASKPMVHWLYGKRLRVAEKRVCGGTEENEACSRN